MYSHREKFDGAGHPCGLMRDAIPLGARVVAGRGCLRYVHFGPAAWLDALNHARVEISRRSGSYFDPDVVDVLLKIPNEAWERLRPQAVSR